MHGLPSCIDPIDFITGNLSANPIQELEQRTGRHAITLLVLSLACTPLNTLFRWSELLKRRRALGLYAFMYATIHVIIFVNLDYGLAWSLIVQTIFEKPYILCGLTAFLMLIPLALTSFDMWKKRLGKNWKRLHQIIYLIAPIVLLHYALGKKGRLLRPAGRDHPPIDLCGDRGDPADHADPSRTEIPRLHSPTGSCSCSKSGDRIPKRSLHNRRGGMISRP